MEKQKILEKMSMEEKVLLLQAKDNWSLNGIERLGIPSVILTDGPSGVRLSDNEVTETLPATAIPTESILSSSWDIELLTELGQMLAEECQQYGVGILLGPGVNAKRSPLGGRNFEYYSEDPFLSGKLAAAMINGVQSMGVGTSLKHYVANDQETRRFTMNVSVDERTLRELLLTPFEIAIKEANPWTIMGAYPKLRGQHLCENSYILEDILRDEYGYEGVVLSDWGAVVNKTASHKNGLDLETGSYERAQELLDSIHNGEVTEDELDKHVMRVLTLIEKVIDGHKQVEVDWQAHHELARMAAAESIVLLKNEDQILPLKVNSEVAVIGIFAKNPRFGGGGSSGTNPKQMDIPYDFISTFANAVYAQGYETEDNNEQLVDEACQIAKGKEAVIIFVGTTDVTESEGADRRSLRLADSQIALVQALAKVNTNIIICNSSGAAVELQDIANVAKAVLHTGLAGEGGGAALADILFGKINPSGKLTETFPVCLENTPAYPDFPGYDDEVVYHEGLLQGYRYYDTKKIQTQYPFGYGLSYTTFEYSNMKISAKEIKNGDFLKVSLDITNTGKVEGSEIVQVYVADMKSYLVRPKKELKGFVRIHLKPQETKTVTVTLDERAFAYYVPHLGRYAVESGTFQILAGASSTDIRLQEEIVFSSADEVRLPLNLFSSMGEYYADDRYSAVTKQIYHQLQITEECPVFPIISSITLQALPAFLKYLRIPEETALGMQQMILNGSEVIKD